LTDKALPRDLGNGLVLRQGTPKDVGALCACYAEAFHRPTDDGPNPFFLAWIRDLATASLPPYGAHNFTIVEDTQSGQIVSSLNLVSQTWCYEEIEFGVGRIEPVGTLPSYRKRGLVRAQFDLAHRWSAERGELVQTITGIPYFYRQFGYEMTIESGAGHLGSKLAVPKLKEGEEEPYRVRPAAEGDLAFMRMLADRAAARYLVTCRRDDSLWRYELDGRSEGNGSGLVLRVIESAAGERVGFLGHNSRLWGDALHVRALELSTGLSWAAVAPSVLRYLQAAGEECLKQDPKATAFSRLGLSLGTEHPIYCVTASVLPQVDPPYAWYVRVPDVPAFLRRIAPVLERRLAESSLAGHSGDLKVSFYRSGVRLVIEQGRLTSVEPWQPSHEDSGQAGFPDLTFLKLLFGYRDYDEIRYVFPDAWADGDEARALLAALFPKRPSLVWPVA